MITILYADATLPLNDNPVATIQSDGSQMTVGAGALTLAIAEAIVPGDLIMFSNAFGNAIQEVTGSSGGQRIDFATTDSMNLNQRTAPAGTIMQLQDSPGSFPPTTATRIWMITYYVDDSTPDSPRLTSRSYNQQRVTGQYQRQSVTTQVSLRSLSFFDRHQ